jgi:hypothetical protein
MPCGLEPCAAHPGVNLVFDEVVGAMNSGEVLLSLANAWSYILGDQAIQAV